MITRFKKIMEKKKKANSQKELKKQISNQKISEMYNNYSKILINWKLEPIALIIDVMSYKDPYSALKVYSLVTVFIHMPVVIFRAYTKIKK